jgi:hypothetical protein
MVIRAVVTAGLFVQTTTLLALTKLDWTQWVPTAVSVLSIGIGVWIADRSIRKNRELTLWSFRATSERDHNRWILDQKKSEWGQLLRSVAEVHRVLRVVSTTEKERAELIAESLKPAVHELVIAQANCIFLQAFFADPERGKKFFSFLAEADAISEKISGLLSSIRAPLEGATDEEKIDQLTKIQELTNGITAKYFEFHQWLREEAALSLGSAGCEVKAN